VGEEVLTGLMDDHPAGRHVLVDLTLALLPLLGPEPRLVGRHWQRRPQLDDAVGALGDLQLRPGLVQVPALAQVGSRAGGSSAVVPNPSDRGGNDDLRQIG